MCIAGTLPQNATNNIYRLIFQPTLVFQPTCFLASICIYIYIASGYQVASFSTLHNYPQLSTTIHDYPQLSTTIHDGQCFRHLGPKIGHRLPSGEDRSGAQFFCTTKVEKAVMH